MSTSMTTKASMKEDVSRPLASEEGASGTVTSEECASGQVAAQEGISGPIASEEGVFGPMTPEKYAERKAAEMAEMQEYVYRIKASDDPHVMYRWRRAVTDVKQMFASSVKLYRDKVLYHQIMPGQKEFSEISYGEAFEDVNALGTALLKLGLKGKHIGIIGQNCYEWAESYLTVIGGVGIVVPLDKELHESELTQLSVEGELEAVICCAPRYYELFKDIKNSGKTGIKYVIGVTAADRADSETNNKPHEDEENGLLSWNLLREQGRKLVADGDRSYIDAQIINDEMAVIIFTSGTTGTAKGVMLSNKNLCADVMIAQTYLEVRVEDIFFSLLPIHHTYECTCTMLEGLYSGASMAFCRGLKYITKDMQLVKPTMLLAVPVIYEKFYNSIIKNVRKQGKEKQLKFIFGLNRITSKVGINVSKKAVEKITANFGGRIRMFIAGGAKVNPEVLDFFMDLGIKSLQGYGLTETSPMVALTPDIPKYMMSDSAGRVLQFTEYKVIDKDENGYGEICFRGPQVMLGYYRKPELTAEVIEDGWFHTGDLGYIDDDMYVHITGRKKNVIITGNGKNVFPEELEEYVMKIPYVEECMVWGDESNEDPLKRGIYVTLKADKEAVAEALGEGYSEEQLAELIDKEIDKVNAELPFYKRITHIVIRKNDFIKTTGMKIKRFVAENKLAE